MESKEIDFSKTNIFDSMCTRLSTTSFRFGDFGEIGLTYYCVNLKRVIDAAEALSSRLQQASKTPSDPAFCANPPLPAIHELLPFGCAPRDLLHAVVGLYDVALSEMSPATIYTATTDPLSYTVIALLSPEDANRWALHRSAHLKKKTKKEQSTEETVIPTSSYSKRTKQKKQSTDNQRISEEVVPPELDHFEDSETEPSTFGEVYTDCANTDSEDAEADEGEEDDEEEAEETNDGSCDYSVGIYSFIHEAKLRKSRFREQTDRKRVESPLTECASTKAHSSSNTKASRHSKTSISAATNSDSSSNTPLQSARQMSARGSSPTDSAASKSAAVLFSTSESVIGIESRLMSACTFQARTCAGSAPAVALVSPPAPTRIVQFHLLAVRRPFRRFGLGRALMAFCMAPERVGYYDYAMVHADADAVPFFTKLGFIDDPLLNRYSSIEILLNNESGASHLNLFDLID